MDKKEDLSTPMLDKKAGDIVGSDLQAATAKASLLEPKIETKEKAPKKGKDKLSHLIRDKKELLPDEFSSIEQLKSILDTQMKPSIRHDWGWIGLSSRVGHLLVTPEDKYLIAAEGYHGTLSHRIKVFDLEKNLEISAFQTKNQGEYIESIALSPDGHHLFASIGSKIICFDPETLTEKFCIDQPESSKKMNFFYLLEEKPKYDRTLFDSDVDLKATFAKIKPIAITGDNKFLVSAWEKSISIFDLSTQKEVHRFQDIHKDSISTIALSNDSKYIISGSFDKSIKMFDLNNKQEVYHWQNISETYIKHVKISHDDELLITCVYSSIDVFSLKTKEKLFSFEKESDEGFNAITFHMDNTCLLAADSNSIRLFDLKTQQEYSGLTDLQAGNILSIAALKEQNHIVIGSWDSKIKIFDLDEEKEISCFENAIDSSIYSMAISDDEKFIVTGDMKGNVAVLDFKTKKKHFYFQDLGANAVQSIAISKRNRYIAMGCGSRIIVLDLQKKEKLQEFPIKNIPMSTCPVAISSDEKFVLGIGYGSVEFFDLSELKESFSIQVSPDNKVDPIRMCLSKEDKYIILGFTDYSIKVFDFKTKQLVYHFKDVHTSTIQQVVASQDNKHFFSYSSQTIKMFDLEKMLLVHEFQNNDTNDLSSISVSMNNKFLVSCSGSSIKIWDLETFYKLSEFQVNAGHNAREEPKFLAITRNNQNIIASLSDRSVRIYSLESDPNPYRVRSEDKLKGYCVSRNKRYLALNLGKKAIIFDFEADDELWSSEKIEKGVFYDISNDGRYLVYAVLFEQFSLEVKVFDFEADTEIMSTIFSYDFDHWEGIQISNNNKYLISWRQDYLEAMEIATKNKLFKDTSHRKLSTETLAISLDDKYIILGTYKGDLSIRNLLTGQEIFAFESSNKKRIVSLAVSNNTKYVAAKLEAGSIKIFDIELKQEVFDFQNEIENVKPKLMFSMDDRYLFAFAKEQVKMLDLYTKRRIQEVSTIACEFVSISADSKYIFSKFATQIRMYPTFLQFQNYVSSKIPPNLSSVNYAGLLLSFDEVESRNRFLSEYSDMYIMPHSWTTLHLLAIYQPSYISQMPKFQDFKVPFLVDKYGKTPLHYLLAQTNLDFLIANILLEYIIDFLEYKTQTDPYESRLVTDSLSNLFLFIVSKAPARLSHKYLNLCYPQTSVQHGAVLPYFGDSEQRYMLTDTHVMNSKILAEVYKEGDDRITFRTNMIKLSYQPDSDDMLMVGHGLSEIEDGEMFKIPLVENLIDHLWESTNTIMIYTFIAFSTLMVLLSVYIGIGERSLLMESMIALLSLAFIGIELIQLNALKEEYLRSIWNWVDLLTFGLIFVFMCLKFANNQSFLVASWMSSPIIVVGYLRWISYLRLFTPTRHLIEIIIVVLHDMLGFLTIIASILVGFSVIFMQFSRESEEYPGYPTHFYRTYQLMFGNYDDSEYNISQIVLTSSVLLVLNVVLLNLLISIIGDSYGKVKDKQEIVDAHSRLDMIQEAMILMRRLRQRNESDAKGYLIYCLPATFEDETLENMHWKSRMNEIKKALVQNEMKVNANVEEIKQEIKQEMANLPKKDEIEAKLSKFENEISQVRTEVQALGKLLTDTLNQLKPPEQINENK